MYSLTYKGQKIFNPVEGKEQELIDLFVDYYGKKHKKRIEERILNNEFIFVSDLAYEQSINFYVHFFENEIQKLTNAAIMTVTGKNDIKNKISINQLEYINTSLKNKTIDGSNYKIVKNLVGLFNLTPNLNNKSNFVDVMKWCEDSQNIKELKEKINQTIDYWKKNYSKEYKTLVDERRKIIGFFMKNKNNMKKGDSLLEEKEIEIVKEYLQENTQIQEKDLNKYTKIYYSILCKGDVEFTKLTYQPKLTDKKYIEFFNAMGYKLGDSINKYKSNIKLKNKLFNKDLYDRLEQNSQDLKENEINSNIYFKNILDNIDRLDIGCGNYYILNSIYQFIFNPSRTAAFMYPYLNKSFTYKTLTVCKDSVITSDAALIHELNHVVSSNLFSKKGNEIAFKIGLEISKYSIPTKNYTNSYDLYCEKVENDEDLKMYADYKITTFKPDMLMEVINEYTSLEISKMAKEKGLKICHGKEFESSYSYAFPIFKKFIETHKDVIKECMMSDSIQKLYNYMGVENFKAMSQIATIVVEEMYFNNKYAKILKEISSILNISPAEVYATYFNDLSLINKQNLPLSEDALEFIAYYEEVNRISDSMLLKENELKIIKEKNKLKAIKKKLKSQEQTKKAEMIELGK